MNIFLTRNDYNYTVGLRHPRWQQQRIDAPSWIKPCWRHPNFNVATTICTSAGNALCTGLGLTPIPNTKPGRKVLVVVSINPRRGIAKVEEWVPDLTE